MSASIWSNPLVLAMLDSSGGGGGGSGSGVDTGLGWNANSNWLIDQTSLIGQIDNPEVGLYIPYGQGTSQVPPSAVLIGGYGSTLLYVWTTDSEAVVRMYATSLNPPGRFFFISNKQDVNIYVGPSAFKHVSRAVTYDGQTFYAYNETFAAWDFTNTDIAIVADETEAVEAYATGSGLATFSKFSPGYSIACICKWKTSSSSSINVSPILISSVESNTSYIRNDRVIDVTTIHDIDTTTFYMCRSLSDWSYSSTVITSNVPVLDLSNQEIYTDDGLFYAVVTSAELQLGDGQIVIQPLSVTQNGTYMPSSGVNGYSSVTVNVPSEARYGTDTGLGWCADGNWLQNSVMEIGSITSDTENLTSSDAVSNDAVLVIDAFDADPHYITQEQNITVQADPGFPEKCAVALYKYWNQGVALVVVSTENYQSTEYWINFSLLGNFQPNTSYEYYGVNYYYSTASNYYSYTPSRTFIYTIYDTLNEAIEAAIWSISDQNIEFVKLNAGYSITCMCKWKTSAYSSVYMSPVLISSIETNTAYLRNNAVFGTVSTHTIGESTFYMRKQIIDSYHSGIIVTSNVPLLDLSNQEIYTDDSLFYAITTEARLQLGSGQTIQSLSVTENGTYTPPTGVNGYSPVIVNVSGGSGYNAFVSTDPPIASIGSDGDYYFQLNASFTAWGLDAPFVSNAQSVGGYSFTVKSERPVSAVGVRVLLRSTITGTIKFGEASGTLIKSVSASYNSGLWTQVMFDEPVLLTPGVEYSVVYEGSSASMLYTTVPAQYINSNINYITGRTGVFPGISESGVAYSCDVILSTEYSDPPYPLKKQYYKSSGVWSEVIQS